MKELHLGDKTSHLNTIADKFIRRQRIGHVNMDGTIIVREWPEQYDPPSRLIVDPSEKIDLITQKIITTHIIENIEGGDFTIEISPELMQMIPTTTPSEKSKERISSYLEETPIPLEVVATINNHQVPLLINPNIDPSRMRVIRLPKAITS